MFEIKTWNKLKQKSFFFCFVLLKIQNELKVGPSQMYMQQGNPMNQGRVGVPMSNFPQPSVLPGPLAFLEKTTSNIGSVSISNKNAFLLLYIKIVDSLQQCHNIIISTF